MNQPKRFYTEKRWTNTQKKPQNMYNIPHIKLTKKAFSPAHSSLLFFPPEKKTLKNDSVVYIQAKQTIEMNQKKLF
jgi:hypothetical protein